MTAATPPAASFLLGAGPTARRPTAAAAPPARLPALSERPRLPRPPIPVDPARPGKAEDGSGAGDVLRLMDALRAPAETGLYAALLRDCDAAGARHIHDHIRCRAGFLLLGGPAATPLVNRLLLAYAAAGEWRSALEVLDGMPKPARNAISWAAVIAGLSSAGEHSRALRLFVEMILNGGGVGGPAVGGLVVAAALLGCCETGDWGLGRCVHGLVLKTGVDCAGPSLARFYSRLGRVDGVRRLCASVSPARGMCRRCK